MSKKENNISASVWVNTDTGEQRQVVETMKSLGRSSRKGFLKVWLLEVSQILTKVGGKKLKVFECLIDKIDRRTNQIYIVSIKKFSEEINVSYKICHQAITIFENEDLIRQLGQGMYMMNPSLMNTATDGRETALLIKFAEIKDVKDSPNE